MRTPPGGLLLALTALCGLGAVLTLAQPSSAVARRCSDRLPLTAGSCGQRVSDLQWLLAGHRPSVFTHTKPTFRGKPNGLYGARTKAAVLAMKFRIGYPRAGECGLGPHVTYVTPTAGRLLFEILEGKKRRPVCWVGLAAKRIAGVVVPGATPAAIAIKLLELSQLGVQEQPLGSNRGPRISFASSGFGPYQGSTGAFGEAWCASFGDWALKRITGHGFGSANDAYVPTIVEYAQQRGWLQAKPRLGSFVVFLNSAGELGSAYHIGYVIRLVGSSGVMTVEGNYSDGVHEVYRPFASWLMVYVAVPGIA